jgi:hypothetical protein
VLILSWADEAHARSGRWPKQEDGPVQAAPGKKWMNINQALRLGLRGLPGGSSRHVVELEQRLNRPFCLIEHCRQAVSLTSSPA